jgi:serine protease inhibitor
MIEQFNLSADLRALGMKDAFGDTANFSGIARSELPSIAAVVHKTFLHVDEIGTQAAGATAVVMEKGEPQSPIAFRANHPFLFLLHHRSSKTILFMGRTFDPRAD